MFVENRNHKGNVAELAIAAEAARLGLAVLKPLTEHERYDLVLGVAGRLLRVQCKWGSADQVGLGPGLGDPASVPSAKQAACGAKLRRRVRVPWGCSSAGRARRWQRRGQGFEPPQLHFPGCRGRPGYVWARRRQSEGDRWHGRVLRQACALRSPSGEWRRGRGYPLG